MTGVGPGTPGRRLKRALPTGRALRAYAREALADKEHAHHADAIAWCKSKHMTFRGGASAPH